MPRPSPFPDPVQRFIAGRFGMWLFIASLAMLFGASLIGFLVIRLELGDDWPADLPRLPLLLIISTIILLISSATIQAALAAIRRDNSPRAAAMLAATLAIGLGFLILQACAWWSWLPAVTERWAGSESFRFALTSFYVLTALHAAHIIGGLIPMWVVYRRTRAARYTAADHPGIAYVAMYWHFLDAVWLVLYAALLLGV